MTRCTICLNAEPCTRCTAVRTWWAIQTPHAVAWVPGETLEAARASLRANTFDGAPVNDWPSVGCAQITRQVLATEGCALALMRNAGLR